MCELGKEAGNVSFHPSTHTSVHPHAHSSLSSALLSSSPSHQLVYDSILALLCCSEEKAFPFLKDVFDSLDILPHKIFLFSLLEGFGERQSSLTSKLFHRVLNKLLRNKESSLNAVFTSYPLSHNAVFSSILSYLLDLALSKNEKMSTASFNGLNSILMWESLPPKLILKHLKEILDGLICFVEKRKAFSKDFLQGLDFLIKRKDTLSCVSFIFKWAVDRISFSKASGRVEMAFCKEILKLLYLKYSKLFIAMFTEKLKGFFYALSDLRDVDLFYTKVDLFVFFVKNTRLFSEKETVVLVKTYFYYILSCNFFILNVSQDTFLTNLSIVSSPEYKEWEKGVLRKGDLIHHLFYELPQDNPHFYDVFDCSLNLPIDVSEEDKYSYYLVNEIVYMHLAFIKKKEVALAPFDIVFNSLPFGLSLPLKMLGMSNPLIKEMLLEKYEECFNSPLSVKVVERMLLIFSVIEMEEDEKLFNFILKIFEEGRTLVESILVSEEPENSIFSKTFELSLKYPNQTVLHMNILRVAYPWLYSSSRKYVEGILKALLDFVEQFPKLCFPLLVRECVEESVLFLVEYVLRNSIAFRNYVNNLSQGFIEESFKGAQEGGSSVNMNSSVHNSNVGVNIHNNSNIHNINNINTRFKNSPQDRILIFLTFLRLIDYEVTPPQINTSIRLYGDLKLLNKDTKRVKDFFRFSINRFSENELNLLFKTDPLLKLTGSCNVKMFKSLSSKSLYGCLLKSINKKDIKSFENLIRFYGEQSWMLIEMFVEEKFYSTRMMEYCRQNLKNVNIRSYLLYYLCTFDPLPEYFPLLLGLSFEERKHTLYSLRKITEKYIHLEDSNLFAGPNLFEESILVYLKDEIQYKTNIHILYPLLSHTPSLLTPKIGRVLCGVVYRLFNTFVQFHQKIGSQLFDSLYIFYEKSSKDKDSKKENGSKDKDSTIDGKEDGTDKDSKKENGSKDKDSTIDGKDKDRIIDGKDITPTTHYSLTTHYPPTAPLQGLYNLLILNYFLSKKTCLLKKYNFLLDLESLRAPFPSESLELQNVISYLEMVIEKGKNEEIGEGISKGIRKEKDDIHNANLHKNYITLNANLHKNTFPNEYLTKLVKFLFNVVRKSWFKFPLSLSTVEFLFPLITPKDFPHLCKEMHKSTFLNFLRVKSQSSVNWKHLLPFIKGVVQDSSQPHPFVFIFQIFCDFSLFLSNTSLFVSFVVGLVEKDYPSLHRTIYDVLLDVKTPPSLQIALLSSLYSKFLFVFKEEDVLNLSLSFFLKNKGAHPGVLTPLNEIFYRGCTHPLGEIREKYIQFLDSLLPRESFMRLKSLLEMDWTGCDLKRVPYIFITLLLEKYQEMKVSREGREMCMCSREGMKEVGVMEEEMMKEDSSGEEIGTSDKLKEACKDNVTSSTSLYFKRDLLDFLYVSPEASLSLLLEIVKFISCEDLEKEILELSPLVSDSLTYTLLKANAYKETHSCTHSSTHSTSPPYTPHSTTTHLPHLSFYFLLSKGNNNLLRYKEMGIKDYVYGCLRSSSKFPEVMQATVFQQVGKYKEALRIYEKLQGLCVEGRVSFYEEEYENILKEWVDSSKEMQQWDICYTLGKFKGDTTLSADSLFFTSNFNIQNEREAFSSMVSLMERGIKKSFYELFYTVYHTPSSESFVDLLIQIVRKMSTGPRTKEFNAYYSTLIQIVLEMHDTVSLFSFRPDTEERINGLAYAWEDREPLIEGPYEVLLLFSTWRRHFFRRVEGYSNETTLPGEQEVDNEVSKEGKDVRDSVSKDVSKDRNNTTVSSPTNPSPMSNPPLPPPTNIGSIVNNNKEFSEAISKLRKTMYIRGNNELGRNANFLALAAYKKGYYDNALFLLKEVFELPSIKILDAYRKVIYELMCFYNLQEYKLGLDLANSTNIVHFSDEQSSTIFRIRGMFSEKLTRSSLCTDDTKRLYFQAIQFFSSSENYFFYANLLYKNLGVEEAQEEIISSALQGLSTADSPFSKHLVILLLLVIERVDISLDLVLFKSLVKSVNLSYFVFFIPRILKIKKNKEYLKVILEGVKRVCPQGMVYEEYRGDSKDVSTHPSLSLSTSSSIPHDFKYLKDLLVCFKEIFGFEEKPSVDIEMLHLVDILISHLVDSITEIDIGNLLYCDLPDSLLLDRLVLLSKDCGLCLKPCDSLADVMENLILLRESLRTSLECNRGRIDTLNKILTEKKLPLFGVYSKFRKDYSTVVYVESFDPSSALRREMNLKEVYLIGSDGKYYKYEIFNAKANDLPSLYHILSSEINSCYSLKSRDAFMPLVETQQIGENLHVDVFDVNFVDFEGMHLRSGCCCGVQERVGCIQENHSSSSYPSYHTHSHSLSSNKNYLVEYVREYIKACQDTKEKDVCVSPPLSFIDLEKNILNLLKPVKHSQENKEKTIPLTSFFKSLERHWSLPKINSKTKLKVYTKVLPSFSSSLSSFFETVSDSSFSYFMQRYAFSKSYALNCSLNNFLPTKPKDPKTDVIQLYTGLFMRRRLVQSSSTERSSIYISPGVQEFMGVDSLEGPFLSCLYLSSDFFLKSESFDLIMQYFNLDLEIAKERLKRVVKVEGDDHEIVKMISEWTDVNVICKNKVSENIWV